MGLFSDSLKKWFYTNNSSAASSDARVPLLKADGTPKGSDTMANLASVLGVIQRRVNIQGNSTLTIPKGKKTAVIMCWCNTATTSAPLIAVCSRTSSIQAVMDSSCITVGQETSNFVGIVVDSDGNIVVYNKLSQTVTFKYHLFLCEQ